MDISMASSMEGMPTWMSGYAILSVGVRSAPPGMVEEERNDIKTCMSVSMYTFIIDLSDLKADSQSARN